jgi:hypothetical protein
VIDLDDHNGFGIDEYHDPRETDERTKRIWMDLNERHGRPVMVGLAPEDYGHAHTMHIHRPALEFLPLKLPTQGQSGRDNSSMGGITCARIAGLTRRDDVLAFYGQGVAVPPLSFSATIKDMKALLHNA